MAGFATVFGTFLYAQEPRIFLQALEVHAGRVFLGKSVDLILEGATNDDSETTVTVEDPTADRTWTIPNAASDTFVGKATTDTLTNKTLTTPVIGAATGTSLAVTGAVTSSGTTGIGYAVGAGGTVTQDTDRTTGVTLSKLTGTIVTHNASLAAEVVASFTVTNTLVAINDVIILNIRSGNVGVNTKAYVSAVAAGSFVITVANDNAAGGTAETGAITINFAVIKGVVT